ncbi:HAD family phosphatase [Candidatus Sumerlaeota bacterium]|nr:HAD family phosphatase [Candidatus Sumerlaeota bacterium]
MSIESNQELHFPPLKAGLIDLGNVVAGFSHERACRQIAALAPASVSPDEIYRFIFGETGWEGLNHPLETGEISHEEFWNRVRARFDLRCPPEEFYRAWSDIFWIHNDVVDTLARIAQSLPLYLCSNTNQLHWDHVARLDPRAAALFSRLFLSHEMRKRKPSEDYFHHVLQEIGLRPYECVFVDDMEVNIRAARGVGLRTIAFNSADQLAALPERV